MSFRLRTVYVTVASGATVSGEASLLGIDRAAVRVPEIDNATLTFSVGPAGGPYTAARKSYEEPITAHGPYATGTGSTEVVLGPAQLIHEAATFTFSVAQTDTRTLTIVGRSQLSR